MDSPYFCPTLYIFLPVLWRIIDFIGFQPRCVSASQLSIVEYSLSPILDTTLPNNFSMGTTLINPFFLIVTHLLPITLSPAITLRFGFSSITVFVFNNVSRATYVTLDAISTSYSLARVNPNMPYTLFNKIFKAYCMLSY